METLIVILIVGLAVIYVGRRFFNNLKKGSQASCGCGCSACDVQSDCADPRKSAGLASIESEPGGPAFDLPLKGAVLTETVQVIKVVPLARHAGSPVV